jgi:hypothetical protein
MSGKAANLNGVLENQGSDLHWQVAFSDTTDTILAFYVQISDRRRRVYAALKFQRGRELISAQFQPQRLPEPGRKRPANAWCSRR